MRPAPQLVALALLVLTAIGCAGGPRPRPLPGERERGLASWYGPGFQGRPTASGEIYDMHELTAAHRTLPFDTRVEVRNRHNGKSVTVRINDRGPFVRGRVIDLSYAAAQSIDLVGPGVAPVEIRVLGAAATGWVVQVGAFREPERAALLADRLRGRGDPVRVTAGEDGWHRVQVGPFERHKRARKLQRKLQRRGYAALIRGG